MIINLKSLGCAKTAQDNRALSGSKNIARGQNTEVGHGH